MRKKLLLWEIVIGFLVSFFLLSGYFSRDKKFEELALGTETVIYQAVDSKNRPIHILHFNANEIADFLKAWEDRGKKNVILFLGNSQTHSINQKKKEEVIFIEILHKKMRSDNIEVLCLSFPNAGLQEFFLAYKYIRSKIPVVELVVPVFYDDLREDGIRDVFFRELVNSKFQLEADPTDALSKKINVELRSYWSSNPNTHSSSQKKDIAALKETFQEKTELYLNGLLESNSSAWRNRPNVRGDFFVWLYRLRNTVLGIKANTIRKMIPQRYEWNLLALRNLVNDCLKNNTHVLLYVPPIRSDVPIPYDSLGYLKFKSTLSELSKKNPGSVDFKDYEAIIPGSLWGFKAATNLTSDRELDYMHFQFKGHLILADSLLPVLKKLRQ